ncbi:MAG: signal peptide peptidase SppA [Proteobacteria bacterium]|nr:signal peptide peptidase SppA [Pseudomonadota bacterium]
MSSTPPVTQPSLLYRFVRGCWRLLDFSRRLAMNLVFLLIVFAVLAALLAERPALLDRTALVIAPDARLVEQYSVDPGAMALQRAFGQGAKEVRLRDILRALAAAKTDQRIERIVIRPDLIQAGGGLAQLREVARALREVRDSGKEVIAYADNLDQKSYLLAAQANTIYLNPYGSLMMQGLGNYRLYYREGLQDKLGVDVHLFRVGEYKSAAEPYILDAASDDAKQADLYWMNDLWQRYLADVGKARGIDPAKLSADIDSLAAGVLAAHGDMAQWALDEHLVDALKTEDQVEAILEKKGVADARQHSFRQVSLDDYLARIGPTYTGQSGNTIAIVVASGEISSGIQPPGKIGGQSTSALIEQARNDKRTKALVLRVDSPGGEAFPSEQIRRQIELTRDAGIPVVVSMGNVAASGGYWISMNANRIYADPSTITGSIGIYGLVMNAPRVLDKLGIHSDGVGTTRWAGAFDATRPLDPAAAALIQAGIEHGYAQFIGNVARARERTPAQIDQIARGRVWSGAQAKDRGLVDDFGGLRDAIAGAAALAHLGNGRYRVHYVEKPMSAFARLFSNFDDSQSRVHALLAASGIGSLVLPAQAQDQITQTLDWLHDLRGKPYGMLAHCLCGL